MGSITLDIAHGDEESEKLWCLRREFSYSLRATGMTKLNEDIVVPRGKLVQLVDFADQLQQRSGLAIACFGHAGDGNIHVNIMVDDIEKPEVRKKADGVLDELFKQVLAWGGVISGEHGIGIAKKRWFPDAIDQTSSDVHIRLKNMLDPEGILNPGKLIPEPPDAD